MKLYFSLKSIPELTGLSPAERRLAWHACKGMAWRRWQTWAATLVGLGAGVFLAYLIMSAIHAHRYEVAHRILEATGRPSWLTLREVWFLILFAMGFLGGGILVGVTQLVRWPVVAGQVRPGLREYVKRREVEIRQIREEVARDASD